MKKILLIALLFLLTNHTHARTPERCIEMMRLHYLWVEQGRTELAKRQFKTAERACEKLLKNDVDKARLTALVLADKNLIGLYERLDKKGLTTTYIYP